MDKKKEEEKEVKLEVKKSKGEKVTFPQYGITITTTPSDPKGHKQLAAILKKGV